MRAPLVFLTLLGLFQAAAPVHAWNSAAHKVFAAITYDRLTPRARARVDELIRRHPDYAAILTKDAPTEPRARARAAFLTASTWPDIIRSDDRLYDDTRPGAKPTPALPGFPDTKKHTNWHYHDIPFSPDGTPLKPTAFPSALSELNRIMAEIAKPVNDPANPAYSLPWLLHLESDIHQPLHCVSRFTKSLPDGDAGGNGVFVNGSNLHYYWDMALGTNESEDTIAHLATEIMAEYNKAHPGRRGCP